MTIEGLGESGIIILDVGVTSLIAGKIIRSSIGLNKMRDCFLCLFRERLFYFKICFWKVKFEIE